MITLKKLANAFVLISCFSLPISLFAADNNTNNTPNLKDQAFQEMLSNYFPLTPGQIHQFKSAVAEQQEANAAPR